MTLKDYIKENKLTVSKFAELAECSQPHISLICKGLRRPSPELAFKIQQVTDGDVRAIDLLQPNHKQAA